MSQQTILTLAPKAHHVLQMSCVWSEIKSGIALCIILFLYLYQDVYVSSKDFEPAIFLIGRPHFTTSTGHGRVFIPQTMVELDEPIKHSDISTKSTACTTDQLKEVGVDYKESRRAALEYEKQKSAAALAKDLGPEVAGQTNTKGPIPQLGVGSAVTIPNISPPMCGIIRWIGTIPQVQGYVAGVELVSHL